MDGSMNWQEEEETASSSETITENNSNTRHNKNQTHNHGRVDIQLLQKQQAEQRKEKQQADSKKASSLAMQHLLSQPSSKNDSDNDVRFRNAHGPMQEQ